MPSYPRCVAKLTPLVIGISMALLPVSVLAVTPPDRQAKIGDHESSSTRLSEVVVTGTRTPHPIDEAPVETYVISRDMIERSGASNMHQLLRMVPGYTSTNLDDTIASDNIRTTFRGLSFSRGYTLVLVDGQRSWGGGLGAHGSTLPTLNRVPISMIERIEIVKGSVSSLYGADAMAGVINIITRSTPREPLATASLSRGVYKVKASDGTGPDRAVVSSSRNSMALSASYGAPIGQDSGFMVLFDHRQDEGHGRLPQKARIDSLLLKANTRVNEALSLEGSVGWDQQRLERTRPPAPGQGRYEREYDTLTGTLGLTWSQGQHHWRTTANWERQDVLVNVRSRSDGDYGNLALESVYTFYGDQHWITIGGEARRDTVDLLETFQGRKVSGIKATIRNYALFVQDEIQLLNERLTVIPGARAEHHSRFGSSFNPQLSTMLELAEGTNLRASVGRSFKSPTIWQLYRDPPTLRCPGGNCVYRESNPDLDPETAWSANLGIEKRWQTLPLWTSASLFGSRVRDMIVVVNTNRQINGVPVRTFDNVDKVNIRGGELAFQLGDYNGLYLKGSGGVTRSTQKSGPYDGKQLTYVPRYQLNLAPGYVSDSGRWGTQLTWSKVGRQYCDRTNDNKIKAHQVVDASAWLMLSTGRLAPKLTLDLGNLTDSDKGVTQPNRYRTGRSIKLSLSGEF